MSDILIFFVPKDENYTFADVVDELSCTYCTVHNWQLHSQDESGWWYAINIYWDNTTSETNARLQSALFMGSAYIYVGHCVSNNKTVFHDVNLSCPRIYDYANLYKLHNELIETHNETTDELNHIKEINEELESANVNLKTTMCKKYNDKCKKYKQLKQHNKVLECEVTRLHNHNQQLFDSFPQHCS
jgi:hypothetical protein